VVALVTLVAAVGRPTAVADRWGADRRVTAGLRVCAAVVGPDPGVGRAGGAGPDRAATSCTDERDQDAW